MAGRPMRKVFCQSLRRDGKPCLAKGFLCANGKYKCRFHGGQNSDYFGFKDRANRGGFKKPKYTDNTRLSQLKGLVQFKNYTHEQLKEYYEKKIRPTLIDGGKSEYNRRATRKRTIFGRNIIRQAVSFQLDEVLSLLKKKS